MSVKVGKKHLQTTKYNYVWKRDKGDGEYTGILDQIKIDKDEGYEVLYFIQKFMNKYNLTTTSDVTKVEDALHSSNLSSIVMRDTLITEVSKILRL
ncbi:hypothetical protein V6238_11965 [Marinomonas arenicola]|uniref:hypothetical protein n=1 Tax=Marinomonas arenicola TaxID=569601 RepID=UPI0031202A59